MICGALSASAKCLAPQLHCAGKSWSLPNELQRELNLPRGGRCGRAQYTRGGIWKPRRRENVCVCRAGRYRIIRVIQDIKNLHAKLSIEILRNARDIII